MDGIKGWQMHSKIFKIFPTNTFDRFVEQLPPSPLKPSALLPLLPLYFKEGFLDWIAFIISLQIPLFLRGGSRGRSGSRWCLVACLRRLSSGQITKLKVSTEISITSLSRPPPERAIVCLRASASGRYIQATTPIAIIGIIIIIIFVLNAIIVGVYLVIYSRHMCVPWYNCLARRRCTLSNTAQANKYICWWCGHFYFFIFSFQKSSFCLFVQPIFLLCPAYISFSFARLYFLPGQIEGRSEDIFPCQAGGRREDIAARLITLYPTNASPRALPLLLLLLQQFTFSFWKLDIWEGRRLLIKLGN